VVILFKDSQQCLLYISEFEEFEKYSATLDWQAPQKKTTLFPLLSREPSCIEQLSHARPFAKEMKRTDTKTINSEVSYPKQATIRFLHGYLLLPQLQVLFLQLVHLCLQLYLVRLQLPNSYVHQFGLRKALSGWKREG
jgi:hypothetical protein